MISVPVMSLPTATTPVRMAPVTVSLSLDGAVAAPVGAAETATGVALAPSPKGAVILFDGSNLDAWQTASGHSAPWKVAEGESVEAGGRSRIGDINPGTQHASEFAPRVLARPGHMIMERLIADTAASTHVGVFRRFEIMRHWHDAPPADAAPMIGSDGLHMTDRGYYCLAAELAEALAGNWRAHRDAARRAQTAAFSEPGGRVKSGPAVAP